MRNAATDKTGSAGTGDAETARDTRFDTRLAEVARDAALSVGPSLRAAFRSTMEVDHKVDLHDPVTVHDRNTERALRAFLTDAVAGSVVIGEEDGVSGTPSGPGSVEWYVDPIDGTANFAAGLAFWCVSIGAVVDGRVVAGAVYDPMADNLFWADGAGAWLGDTPLRGAGTPGESRAVLLTGYPSARDLTRDGTGPALDRFARLTSAFATLRRPGSAALCLCHVAPGWGDAAAGFSVNAWDVTASIAILRGAGGVYRPFHLDKPADLPDHACPGYLATGPGAHYPTLAAVCDEIDRQRTPT